jgi:hypothetical protein
VGIFDLIRSPSQWLSSPATRRLYEAERAAEVWSSAPAPAPGLGEPPPARTPPINWTRDQPPASPRTYTYQPGYSDHTYQQFSAPIAFDGFSLDRIHAAVSTHRTAGNFYETSALMVSVLSYAPVLAALQQAIAPILALPRHIHGGDKGLSKLVANEVREQLVPRGGLRPSPFFPPALWGTTAIYLRMMGFSTWQHVDGDMDPETGIRDRYTRIWEPWAVQRTRSPRKALAYTTEGPVEIVNDGKFTMVECVNEGYLHQAAILAIAPEAAAGKLTQEARLRWLDFFSSPKLVLTLPEHVPTQGEAGDDFARAVDGIFGPDGRAVVPFGTTVDTVAIKGEGADQFNATIIDGLVHVFMVLTGSAGTIGNGMNQGGEGQTYQPAKGGSWTVRHDLIAEPTLAIACAANQGHVAPFAEGNYGNAIAGARRAGTWKDPVLEIPIPAPDRDERIASDIDRHAKYVAQLKAEQEIGAPPDQAKADKLAERFEVVPVKLSRGAITTQDMALGGVFTPDEYRSQKGYDALAGGAGAKPSQGPAGGAGGGQEPAGGSEAEEGGEGAEPDDSGLRKALGGLDAAVADHDDLPDDDDDDGAASPTPVESVAAALARLDAVLGAMG